MSLLRSILRVAHCQTTHDCFAIDALRLVQTPSGQRLRQHILRHYGRYLDGANDPDVRFRDYQNHVVHVSDGGWGGAPRAARQWYHRMMRYLRTDRFSDAAHAAGVISHYFADAFQPLHTEFTDADAIRHQPLEYCVLCAYDDVLQAWREDDMRIVFDLGGGPDWLAEAIVEGAKFAHRKRAIIHREFDLQRAVDQPQSCLDGNLTGTLSELFGLVITGWARVIERCAEDAEASRGRDLPKADLMTSTLRAMLGMPAATWGKTRWRRALREQVRLQLEEYDRSGVLVEHLPAEVDVVQRVIRVHHQERQWQASRTDDDGPTILVLPERGRDTRSPQPSESAGNRDLGADEAAVIDRDVRRSA